MSWSTELFQTSKPIIGLLHLDPLPGDPFYKGSMEQIIENATHDLKALQNGGAAQGRSSAQHKVVPVGADHGEQRLTA